MVSHRKQGVLYLCLCSQLAAVTLCFWAWVCLHSWRLLLENGGGLRYLFYNEFILIGVVLGFDSRSGCFNAISPNWSSAQTTTVRQLGFSMALVCLILVAVQDIRISRIFLFSFVPVLFLILLGANLYLPQLISRMLFKGHYEENTLLLGSLAKSESLAQWLENKKLFGLSVAGVINDEPQGGAPEAVQRLGRTQDLERVIRESGITQVIVLDLALQKDQMPEVVEACEKQGVRLLAVSDFESQFRHSVSLFEDDGICFIGLRDEALENPFNRILKRCVDILIALPATLLVLPPVTFMVWLIQRCQSPGPVFFVQRRVGMQNRPFNIYKYRTMDCDRFEEARQALPGDSRVYAAGRWLRKFSMDELPQFVNVLCGQMSLVGPRPHLLEHNNGFEKVLRNYRVRAMVKPGMTGLAQISGYRGATRDQADIAGRVKADIYYLENWSFALDCWIILKTFHQVIRPPRSAY
jgi:putative colanic acid biosynthesis UDP-glucose lipid carrier transferase